MVSFSRRNKYNEQNIQTECASDTLRRRIFTAFFKKEFDVYDTLEYKEYTTGIEDMMIEMGIPYEFPIDEKVKKQNSKILENYLLHDKRKWYEFFDFIERYLNICDNDKQKEMARIFNDILVDECSAYRIVENLIVPITNEFELATIEDSRHSPYQSVNTHISKALELFANRKNPDFENSIKESISAVEAMCCIITGMTGSSATLGKALKNLKENGIHIHSAMESAFSSLYGYTSDENGIRHGGIDFTNAPAEDAKFMLVSCSAFINYLIEKKSKIG